MATTTIILGGQEIAVDDTTHELVVKASGITFDGSVDIGDVNLLNAAGTKINPATQESLAAILAKLIAAPATEAKQDIANASLDTVASATGLFTVVSQGRTSAVAGAVAITLHATTACKFFRFWLDPGASSVQVDATGAAADGDEPSYDSSMGPQMVRLATPATAITVYFAGSVGYLNWVAGN